MLFERGPPRNQAETESVINHGEPSTRKLRGADQRPGNAISRNGRLPFPSPFGGERAADALDVTSLKPLHHVARNPDPTVADVRGIAFVSQPSPAPGQRSSHIAAEAVFRQDGALASHQLPVEPRHAIMTDLLLEPSRREHGHPTGRAVPSEIVGLTALDQVGRNAPVVGIDSLDMACQPQRLQAPDMGSDVSRRIAAQTLDGTDGLLQMRGRPIDALLTGDGQDVAIRCAGSGLTRARRHDHAPLDILRSSRIHTEMVDSPVHTVDDEPHPLAHLVAGQPLVEHPANDRLGHLLTMKDIARDGASARQSFLVQCSMHSLDDVAALAQLPQHGFGLGRYRPPSGLNLGGQAHTLQFARPLDQQRPVLPQAFEHVPVRPQVGKLISAPLLGEQHAVEAREPICIDLPLEAPGHRLLGLAAEFSGHDLACPLPDAISDVIASDVEGLVIVGHAPNDDVSVRMAGVVVIDRDPVEAGAKVGLHLLHEIAGSRAMIRELHALLGRYDEAELVAVFPAPFDKRTTILGIPAG